MDTRFACEGCEYAWPMNCAECERDDRIDAEQAIAPAFEAGLALGEVVAMLSGLDLSDPYAPTPGDAVALRGGVLVEAEAWGLLAFDEDKFDAAEQNAQRIARRDPARAARIRDLVGRMRAATVAHVEREAGL